jgi:2-polyprenyl-3-methyl-5-hydroxy-6-metoxy-1,4-benzoquinol methylase
VKLNEFGFYELAKKPTEKEVFEYYEKKYYQENLGIYNHTYSNSELKYIKNKIIQKENALSRFCSKKSGVLLDVGCGEGFSLAHYHQKGWQVTGIDFSITGISTHNADMKEYFIQGNIFEELDKLITKKFKADVIWLDNVLEHAIEPLDLLEKCAKLANEETYLVVEVPNDFSIIQQALLEHKILQEPNWVFVPDHISYFNINGLNNLAVQANWEMLFQMSDFPIDFFLFNDHSNYYADRQKGKEAHKARIIIENLLHETSIEKTVDMYQAMAQAGVGRLITAFFKINNNKKMSKNA